MAALYVQELLRLGFREPFWLGGFSAGATIAFEMARQLEARGCLLALFGGCAALGCAAPAIATPPERFHDSGGDADPHFVAENEQLHRELLAAKVSHAYAVYPGAHTGAFWAAHEQEWIEMAVQQLTPPEPSS